MKAVEQARSCGARVSDCAAALGVSRASYYRYRKDPELRKRRAKRKGPPPTPSEEKSVVEAALLHPATGYKRLTWLVQNEEIAGLRAHQVRTLLQGRGLLGNRCVPVKPCLKKPELPSEPNQVWHIDLMYVWLGRWYFLTDILDGFSRYVVHWTLEPSMQAHTVTLAVQEALERWSPARPPAIVHDSGCQFRSKEWADFVSCRGLPSIRTRVAHPESNGLIERLHRTHRAEALVDTELWTLEQARREMSRWVGVYNNLRPHSSLHGLPPVVYYLGDPEAARAQREHYVLAAAEARAYYWQQNPQTIIE